MAERTKDPVLIILHQEHSTPGRVGRLIAERGHRLDIRRPRYGDPLPETMAHHAGAVIFGGPMSANDPDDFVKREIDWIGVPLKEDRPYLGLCLGAQMLALHLGGRVWPHPDGRAEIGYFPLVPTKAGERVAAAGARPGRTTSTIGTARASTARPAPRRSRRATISRPRRFSPAPAPTACSSTRR